MADSLDVRDEEKLLECAICLSRLNAPRRLDCRHVFCFNCIKKHYKNCGKRLAPCPICRKLYPSMNVTIDNLPQCSIPLDQLLDMRNSRHSCESGLCQSSHAPFLCLGCKKWLCFSCKEHDDETAPCPSHEAYRIADIDARLYNIVMQSQEKHCVEHPSHELQWFCRQCNILGCNYCKKRQPLDHSLITVNEKAAELRELFKDVCAVLKQKAEEHEKARDFFNQIGERLSPGICNVDFCEKSANEHKDNVSECNGLIQIMTYLEEYASSEVLVAMYLNMEDQLASEIAEQPLNKLKDHQHWLRDTTLMSSGGKDTLTKLGNKREIPTDTDLSKKIKLTYYCNCMASILGLLIFIVVSGCILGIIYHWSGIWEGIKNSFYVMVREFLHSRLEGMINDIFTPELLSQYANFTKEIESVNVKFVNNHMMDIFKHYIHEYCHGNIIKHYGVYGGDVRFRYDLNISTFCIKK